MADERIPYEGNTVQQFLSNLNRVLEEVRKEHGVTADQIELRVKVGNVHCNLDELYFTDPSDEDPNSRMKARLIIALDDVD